MFGKDFKDGEMCPLIQAACVTHKCAWYMKVVGMDPQTGQPVDRWGCAIAWAPILTIENSNQQRQTAASVEKVSKEIARTKALLLSAMSPEAQARIRNTPLLEDTNGSTPDHR